MRDACMLSRRGRGPGPNAKHKHTQHRGGGTGTWGKNLLTRDEESSKRPTTYCRLQGGMLMWGGGAVAGRGVV